MFWLIVLLPTLAVAADDPLGIAKRLQETYDKTSSITAEFRQVTSSRMSRRVRRGSGKMVIQKPGKMRWDYGEPEPQVIICDGETILMYFTNAKQMLTAPAEDYLRSDITYSFFAGTGNILKDFDIYPPDLTLETDLEPSDDSHSIKLVPKVKHPQVEYLHVWVDRKHSMISRMQIVDLFGSITDLYFTHIETNRKIDRERFQFTPPPDTEIIRQ